MSDLQKIIEDYLLEQGWRATGHEQGELPLRYWKDPEHMSAPAVGLTEAVRKVVRRERRRAGLARSRMEQP